MGKVLPKNMLTTKTEVNSLCLFFLFTYELTLRTLWKGLRCEALFPSIFEK